MLQQASPQWEQEIVPAFVVETEDGDGSASQESLGQARSGAEGVAGDEHEIIPERIPFEGC